MKTVIIRSVTLSILLFGITSAFGQNISDEARRHFDRGVAAVEIATSPADYELAIKEFEQAARLAPDWPDVFYNLGMVQEKAEKYSDAITNLKQYLRLAPNATDAEMVSSLINKLEYKKDQEEGVKNVYVMMTYSTNTSAVPYVSWKQVSKKGDTEPDWEIEHNDDHKPCTVPKLCNPSILVMKEGTLYKGPFTVKPMNLFLVQDVLPLPVKVNGRFFEYRYPFNMYWLDEIVNGTKTYGARSGGELSIKGEIISVDPARIKREQTVKWPDGRTSVTEFVYELIF